MRLFRLLFVAAVASMMAPWLAAAQDDAGVRLMARDVDGDLDLDLIVISGVSHQPIDVFINDGQGRFSRGRISDFPAANWTVSGGVAISPVPIPEESAGAELLPFREDSPATIVNTPQPAPALSGSRDVREPVAPTSRRDTGSAPRAPPAVSL